MNAIQFDTLGGPEVLRPAEVAKPEVRAGMVLIKVRAAGVNFADTLFTRGQYAIIPRLPDVPGMEAAGDIEAVGEGVEELKPGMRVAAIALRCYAEYCLARPNLTIPLPDSLGYEEGAAFPIQTLTAYHLLHTAHRTAAGDTVLVHAAAGGVGSLATQIAKAAGARVIGTVSSSAKAALVRELGADEVIDYRAQDFAAEVMRLTGGRGVDLILDAVGKPTFGPGLSCLAPFGQLILYGRAGGTPDPVSPPSLFAKSLTVSAFSLPVVYNFPDLMARGIVDSLRLLQERKVRLVIGKTIPLTQAAEAHRLLLSRASTGKLVLKV
ncbi:MAG TPA: quinone oxidoreductase [Candidatus Binataceae bacterium]|nr:quinone oxidoreductase [Candidatus Binataceae bacterium]